MRHLLRRAKTSSAKLSLETLERRDCPAAISISSATVIEGTSASTIAQFKVSLSAPTASPVTVDWKTADDTATAGVDYRAAMGTVRFAPGQTSRTISVAVFGDAVIEPNETFMILLSNPVGADLPPQPAAGSGTIVNDDVAQNAVPEITVSDVQLPERNAGRSDALFTVSLSAATSVPVTLSYTTADGSATASDRDYAPAASRLTFAPGETQKTVAVGVLGDARIESDESFTLLLSNAVNATFAKTTGTATIFNDDVRSAPPPVVTVTGGTVVEGTAGDSRFIDFTVKLSGAASRSTTVTYETFTYETFIYDTFTGLARVADNDYRAGKGTLVFQPGEKEKTVKVGVVGDTKAEPDEVFGLLLTSASGATIARSAGSAVGTILDDDTPPSISVADVSLIEGNSGTVPATFVITLSRPWSQAVTVNYETANGTALTSDNDYIAANGLLEFEPGETQQTVSVSVIGDTKAETDERFTLVLSGPTNATIKNGTGIATIRNDDSGDVPGFQIELNFTDPALPEPTRSIFKRAANRWSEIITGDLPAASYGGKVIDDFLLDVTVKGLEPDLLGQANFYSDSLRPGSKGLPFRGFAEFNSLYMAEPGIYYTILHEMGHALGFSPDLWRSQEFNLVSGWGAPGASDPRFRGPNATREFNAYFATTGTSVPLEDLQGPGSYGAHWRESVFGANKELMTYSWDVRSTAANPISRVTIGAMADIGYQVNYAAADTYVRPAGAAAARTTPATSLRSSTTSFAQSPLSLAFALHQQLAEAKPSDGTSARNSAQRR